MTELPSRDDLEKTLSAAGSAHHEYEQNALDGLRDEQWEGWYAAYVLGRLGDFAPPSSLTRWIREAPAEADWAAAAAGHLEEQLRDGTERPSGGP